MAERRRGLPLVPMAVAAVILGYGAYKLHHIMVPFLLGVAASYIVNPILSYFEARGLRRAPLVTTLYLGLALLLGYLASQLIPVIIGEWSAFEKLLPTYLSYAQKFMGTLPDRLHKVLPVERSQVAEMTANLSEALLTQAGRLPSYIFGLFPLLSLFFLVPFISFFLLVDFNRTLAAMIQACPSRYVEEALYLLSEIDTSLGNYLRGIVIEAAAVGLMLCMGLLLLGNENALAIAAVGAVSCLIPYLGAAFASIVGALSALYQFGSMAAALKVIALFALVRLLDDWLMQPIIIKHSVALHPLAFIFALMVGGELFGIVGLIFAVPAACVVKTLVKVAFDWYATEAKAKAIAHVETGLAPYT